MADLMTGRDRGQLILVTALVIATVLVALVLLVNAAIFTENLATREPDTVASDALSHRASVVDGVGGIVNRENTAGYENRTYIEGNVTAGVRTVDEILLQHALTEGAIASVNASSMRYVNGSIVRQTDEDRQFTSESGNVDWRLASDVNRTRRFIATVNTSQLNETTAASPGSAFHVVLAANASTKKWRAYVYKNETTDDIEVAVENPDGPPTRVCSVDNSSVENGTATIGFTTGTLEGRNCDGLDWARGLPDRYDIEYVNGDEATGTYQLTVRTHNDGLISTGNLLSLVGNVLTGDDPPYWGPAVYAVEVEVTYESPSLAYRATVRIAPGEPR